MTTAFFCGGVGATEDGEPIYFGVHDGSVGNGAPDSFAEAFFVLRLTGGRRAGRFTVEVFALFPDQSRERVLGPNAINFDGPAFGHTINPPIRIPSHTKGSFGSRFWSTAPY